MNDARGSSGSCTGFSASRTKLRWNTHQVPAVWVGVVRSSPGRRLTRNPGGHLPEKSGNSRIFASSDGIARGCTNHAPRTMSCDPAACEDLLDNLYQTCDEWDSIALLFYSAIYRVFIPVGLQYSCDGPSFSCAHPQLNCPIGALLSWVAQPIPVVVDYEQRTQRNHSNTTGIIGSE